MTDSGRDRRIPVESYLAAEDEAVKISGDPYFGLHMGEFFEPGHWSILGFMMMNCSGTRGSDSRNNIYAKTTPGEFRTASAKIA